MRTEIAELVLLCAKRVLDGHAEGRIYHPLTVEWAREIARGNAVDPPAISALKTNDPARVESTERVS